MGQAVAESEKVIQIEAGSDSANDLKKQLQKVYSSSKSLETEYIKSLQQQIYLLELENGYIRKQSTDNDIVTKLKRELQGVKKTNEGLKLELKRRDGHIEMLTRKHGEFSAQIKSLSAQRSGQRESLSEQLIRITNDRDAKAKDNSRLRAELEDLRLNLNRHQTSLKAAEEQIETLRNHLSLEMQRCCDIEKELFEKKLDHHRFEEIIRQVEDDTMATMKKAEIVAQENIKHEIKSLESQLMNVFELVEQKKVIHDRHMSENIQLAAECSSLRKEINRLQKKIGNTASPPTSPSDREDRLLKQMRQRYYKILGENERLQKKLASEKGKNALKELTEGDTISTDSHNPERNLSVELEEKLKKELITKALLNAHVANLESQLRLQAEEISKLRKTVRTEQAPEQNKIIKVQPDISNEPLLPSQTKAPPYAQETLEEVGENTREPQGNLCDTFPLASPSVRFSEPPDRKNESPRISPGDDIEISEELIQPTISKKY